MEMLYDFTETNSTITVFIYKKNIKDMKLSPGLQNPKRLIVSEDIAIDLYRDVYPDIELQESKSRIEIHLKKIEHVKWGGINGKVPSSYGSREEKPIVEDDASEDANSAVDLFSKIYQKSGDDVRRAMEKSFYESEGTVLSTDWSQVKSKKVNREE